MSAEQHLLSKVWSAVQKAPVLLFGPPASGKTNLVLWLGSRFLQGRVKRVYYISTEGRVPYELIERFHLGGGGFLAAIAVDSHHLIDLVARAVADGSGSLIVVDSINSFYRSEIHDVRAGRRLTVLMALLAHSASRGVKSLITAQIMERPEVTIKEYRVSGYWGISPFISLEIEVRRLPSGARVLLLSTRPSQIDQCYRAVIDYGGITISYCDSEDDESVRVSDDSERRASDGETDH